MPSGSWVATAKFKHATINADGKAAGLALINSVNPNHLLKTTLQYKGDADPNTAGNQPGKWAERVLTANNASVILPPATVPWPNSGALNLTGEYVYVRFVYDDATKQVTTWSSANGTTFASFGAPISVTQYLSQAGGLRVGVFAKHDGAADDTVQFDAFNVVSGSDPQTPGDNCGGSAGCPQTDEFLGTTIDPKWAAGEPDHGCGADGGQRPPGGPAPAGRPVRGERQRPVAAAAGPGRLVEGDRQGRARGSDRGWRGARSGADQQLQPEPLRQGDRAVQERHRSEHRRQPAGQVGGAGADVQQRGDHAAAGDRAVPELGCARGQRRLRLGAARL